MTPINDLAGIVFGLAGFLLGIAMLIVEHRDSPMLQRIAVGVCSLLCFLVAVDGSVSLRTIFFDFSPSPIAVGFAATLSINWAYRLRSHAKRPRETRSQ